MKTLRLKQLIPLLDCFPNGKADFKQKLTPYSRPMRRLWFILSNPDRCGNPEETYKFVFENNDYKRHFLTTLKAHMREALTDFLKLRITRTSGKGQNLIAKFYAQNGLADKADKANNESLILGKKEGESERWLAKFEAYTAMHLRGKTDCLVEAEQALFNFFLVNYLKFTVEQLTLFRIKNGKKPIEEAKRLQINKVVNLLPTSPPPIIAILAKAVAYYLDPDFKSYEAFKLTFFKLMGAIDSDRKYLLNSLLNAVALYPNPGEEIKREYLPLYQFGIENTLFIEDGELEIRTVCNILVVASAWRDYKLVKLAKQKLIPLFDNDRERNWFRLLADIYCLFGVQEFELALEKIKEFDNENSSCFAITFSKLILKAKCIVDNSISFSDAHDNIIEVRNDFEEFLKQNLDNENFTTAKRGSSNFFNLLIKIYTIHGKKYTKNMLMEELASYKGNVLETNWLKEKINTVPYYDYIRSFMSAYDKAHNKYEALEFLQDKETGFRKILSRYRQKGYIDKNRYQSSLNFFNLLTRICDERNPKNRKRHLLKKLESYDGLILEKTWIELKLKKIRP